MSVKRADGVSIAQALAMTVAEIPVFLYSTFGQVYHFVSTVMFCIFNFDVHLRETWEMWLRVSFFFLVHIFPAKTYPKLEESALRHSAGQRRSGANCSSAEKTGEEEEADDATEGRPEDSGDA